MFYSIIFTVFCATMISAALPPRDVYSAVILNSQNQEVECTIKWSDPRRPSTETSPIQQTKPTEETEKTEETDEAFLEHNKRYVAAERFVSMGTWKARAAISQIICGDLTLSAPFAGVNGPSTNWLFRVEKNRIVSVGPSQ